MSKLFRFCKSLGKINGKKGSQVWILLLIKGVKLPCKKVWFLTNFALLAGLFWYLCYYPHRSRDALFPVCGIFVAHLPNWSECVQMFTKGPCWSMSVHMASKGIGKPSPKKISLFFNKFKGGGGGHVRIKTFEELFVFVYVCLVATICHSFSFLDITISMHGTILKILGEDNE